MWTWTIGRYGSTTDGYLQFGEEGERTKDSALGARVRSEGGDRSTATAVTAASGSVRSDASKDDEPGG